MSSYLSRRINSASGYVRSAADGAKRSLKGKLRKRVDDAVAHAKRLHKGGVPFQDAVRAALRKTDAGGLGCPCDSNCQC